jgi:hypothetical protein
MATVDRALGLEIAGYAAAGDAVNLRDGLASIVDAGDADKRGTWAYFASRFVAWLDAGTPANTPFAVWSLEGNVKLPFAAFSTLPIVTCPGAGACALDGWCYSLKAWRYPAAYFRQVQNTFLLTKSAGRRIVAEATNALPADIACRLYVDGDFATVAQVAFWMAVFNGRPDLSVYGYSKSWRELLAYDKAGGKWPANYCLNLSNGGNAENLRPAVAQLPIVRGNFLTVPIDKRLAGKYGTKEYKDAVRQAAAQAGISRPFVCPGKCGECTPKGHLCGRPEAAGVNVVIGVH